MNKIENKKNAVKNKFTQYCRAVLLSLFVTLMIPSISSGIFGNGDAEAGCNPVSGGSTSVSMTSDLALEICGPVDAACRSTTFAGETVCVTDTEGSGSCTAVTSTLIRCVSFISQDMCAATNGSCVWSVEDTQNNKLVDAVCRVYQIATGTAGKAFAAVGVISVGIGFFTGKVSWGLMISVAAGIAVFFGAPSIIAVISGDQSATALCSNVSQ